MKKTEIETKQLTEFIQSVKFHIAEIDRIMKLPESPDRGKIIAKEMNRFDMDNDRFLHFGLNLSFDKMKTILNKSFKLQQHEKNPSKRTYSNSNVIVPKRLFS